MINLTGTVDKLQLTCSAAGQVDFLGCWADWLDSANDGRDPDGIPIRHTAASTVDFVVAPGAGKRRNVQYIGGRNSHASVVNTVTITRVTSTGPVTVEICKVTLQPGEWFIINEQGTFYYYDASGRVQTGASLAGDSTPGLIQVAVQTDMEAGTILTEAVTPGRQHFHPGHPKCWLSCGIAADIQQSYNITSLTDTGTGIVTITINNDFAAATWCCVPGCEAPATTWGVGNTREVHIRLSTRAAGSVALDSVDNTGTTSLIKDPQSWSMVGFGDLP